MNLRFPGQYYDVETGLFYNYFRDYNPATGRYIASDPIGLQGGLNTCGYVGGNPLSWVDPNGLNAVTDGAKWGGKLGGSLAGPSGAFLGAIIGGVGGAVVGDAVSNMCPNEPKKPKCYLEREVYYGGPEKSCLYRQPGSIFTIRQFANKACPPIDPETCWVDTTGTPEEKKKPPNPSLTLSNIFF